MNTYLNIDKKKYIDHLYFLFLNISSIIDWSIYDIKLKFKRTQLGLLWEFLNIIILSTIMSVVFSVIFKETFLNYFLKIFLAYTTWSFISKSITDSTKLITERYNAHILNTRLPIIAYSCRMVISNSLIYLIYLPLIILLYFSLKNLEILSILLLLLGFILVVLNLLWISLFLSITSARFRDLSPLISAIMAPMLILTPILWEKSKLGVYEMYAYINPFTSFIEVMQKPLLNSSISTTPYLILLFLLILGNLTNYLLYKFKGTRFVFWAH